MSECYSFVVNGVPCSTEEEKPLLRYLRDELRLTSVCLLYTSPSPRDA